MKQNILAKLAILCIFFIALSYFLFYQLMFSMLTGVVLFLVYLFLYLLFGRSIMIVTEARRTVKLPGNAHKNPSIKHVGFYAIFWNLTLFVPLGFLLYLVHKPYMVEHLLNEIPFHAVFIPGIIIVNFYYSILFFINKKRRKLLYLGIWLATVTSTLLDFYSDMLLITGVAQRTLKLLSFTFVTFVGFVEVWSYADKITEKEHPHFRKYWINLVQFLGWDFLKSEAPQKDTAIRKKRPAS